MEDPADGQYDWLVPIFNILIQYLAQPLSPNLIPSKHWILIEIRSTNVNSSVLQREPHET